MRWVQLLVVGLCLFGCSSGSATDAPSTQGPSGQMLEVDRGLPDTGGVGEPCTSSAECVGPLGCYSDNFRYVGHRQCTLPCAANSECETSFGASTLCTREGFCARRCVSDDDCPALTLCNDTRWCQRGGPGSGIPHCSGSGTPCAALTQTSCQFAEGCYDTGDCLGAVRSCALQHNSFDCNEQQGCYWNSVSGTCAGTAFSCSTYYDSVGCGQQAGCYWSHSCSGVATQCSSLPLSLCDAQPGCLTVPQ